LSASSASMRNLSQFWTALALAACAGDTAPTPLKGAKQLRVRKASDPLVVLQYRVERRVRKAAAHRKRSKLPEVTEDEIREWVKEEAQTLGLELELKESSK